MQDFETEEQQIEALKTWWKENGTFLLLGLGLGAAVIFGWRYYVSEQQSHAMQASDMYIALQQQVSTQKLDDAGLAKAQQLKDEFSDTPYAPLASLMLAKHAYENGNVDEAISKLEWVVGNADEVAVEHIAKLRLIRVLLSQKQYERAEALLLEQHPPAFDARYEELKGDLYVAKGEPEQARIAYDKAISEQGAGTSQWLRLKRKDLGDSKLQDSAQAEPST